MPSVPQTLVYCLHCPMYRCQYHPILPLNIRLMFEEYQDWATEGLGGE